LFDEHWENLRDHYPYFERYGVDWEAERAEHRPSAVAAEDAGELAWEIARLLTCVRDAHTTYLPPPAVLEGWSVPDLKTARMEGRFYLVHVGDDIPPFGPARYRLAIVAFALMGAMNPWQSGLEPPQSSTERGLDPTPIV